jgi:ubiquinone/menaquinone biosynthesis C-methylase UbiE
MSYEKWKMIWESRTQKMNISSAPEGLEKKMWLNGYDTSHGNYNADNFSRLASMILDDLKPANGSKLLDLGCGSGAMLEILQNITAKDIKLFGVDYSEDLIRYAKTNLHGIDLKQSAANKMPYKDNFFDFVISHGVFLYFPSQEYALDVLCEIKRVCKNSAKVVLMDMNDSLKMNDYHKDRSAFYASLDEYNNKYSEINHLFFNKKDFLLNLEKLKFSDVRFFDHYISDYFNAKYRFNVSFTVNK